MFFFFFNDTATTEIYTLSLHDALPISIFATVCALLIILGGAISIPTLPIALFPNLAPPQVTVTSGYTGANAQVVESAVRSEEHTSELQSRSDLVCRLLLEKKQRDRALT